MANCNAILNLLVFRLGHEMTGNQLMGIVVRAFGNDAVGLAVGESRKSQQLLLGRFVDVDGLAFSPTLLQAFGYRFCVPAHLGCGLCCFFPQFVGVLPRASRAHPSQGKDQTERNANAPCAHETGMPWPSLRLAMDVEFVGRVGSAVYLWQ